MDSRKLYWVYFSMMRKKEKALIKKKGFRSQQWDLKTSDLSSYMKTYIAQSGSELDEQVGTSEISKPEIKKENLTTQVMNYHIDIGTYQIVQRNSIKNLYHSANP